MSDHALRLYAQLRPRPGGTSISRHREQLRKWSAAHPEKMADPEVFASEILPMIQELPLSDLARGTGLSAGYLSLIRRGERSRTRDTGLFCGLWHKAGVAKGRCDRPSALF
jgi:hypothetical protein